MLTKARRLFFRSEKGVAAIEFAFIFPIFALALVGVSDLVAAAKLDRDLKRASAAVAHIATRTGSFEIVEKYLIVTGLNSAFGINSSDDYKIVVQSVVNNDGALEVDWTWAPNGTLQLPPPEEYFADSLAANRGGIIVRIEKKYKSLFDTGGFGEYAISGTHASTSSVASRVISSGNGFF